MEHAPFIIRYLPAPMQKTLAMKVLEGQKVAYEAVTYGSGSRDAVKIAAIFGVPPEQVFKTLVVPAPPKQPRIKPMLVMIPANAQLNLKKLAKIVGAKKLAMAKHAEAEKMTGLQVGGISPLALLNKRFAIYIDESAKTQDASFVSAGVRGINLKVETAGLVKVTKARWAGVADF